MPASLNWRPDLEELPAGWHCYLCDLSHDDPIHTITRGSSGAVVNGKWMPNHYARFILREGRSDWMSSHGGTPYLDPR
jgi:hypothetical protein